MAYGAKEMITLKKIWYLFKFFWFGDEESHNRE